MRLSRPMRKAVLIVHVIASVGWLGSVMTSLCLALVALTSSDPVTSDAAYVALDVVGTLVVLPFAAASLASGVLQSLGTSWGLVRHYWVLFKLVINLLSLGVLLLYAGTLDLLADPEKRPQVAAGSPVVHTALAAALLVGAVVLSVVKPRGLTPWASANDA
jgi:hypothetical protein